MVYFVDGDCIRFENPYNGIDVEYLQFQLYLRRFVWLARESFNYSFYSH